MWNGKGPVPDFTDIEFWEQTWQDLNNKTSLVEAGGVEPQFTPEELETLEHLEDNEERKKIYHQIYSDGMKHMPERRERVLYVLMNLALHGRPGQWILHQQGIFHPCIDTRAHTRDPASVIPFTGPLFDDDYEMTLLHHDKPFPSVLMWGGPGPCPDPKNRSLHFWEKTYYHLLYRLEDVKLGCVAPQFTEAEEAALQAMEREEGHIFAIAAAKQRANPVDFAAANKLTPEEIIAKRELAKKIASGHNCVYVMLLNLWNAGLDGRWVLHHEPLYLLPHDTRMRLREYLAEDDGYGHSESHPHRKIITTDYEALCFDGTVPGMNNEPPRFMDALPDFDNPDFWMAEARRLDDLVFAVYDGKVKHRFTDGEIFHIRLVEQQVRYHDIAVKEEKRAWNDRFINGGQKVDKVPKPIRTWLDGLPMASDFPVSGGSIYQLGTKRKQTFEKDDIELIRIMVKRYMGNPRSIILAVIPRNVDIASQEILRLAADADPDGLRTIGVLTNVDLCNGLG
ncbi:hypothetical protein SCUCBS95973_000256 [Sporothrix curviconia]|uniref:Dynamin N-terminal domain-containing protein n=1 Tax=Sporothrix curviconia TaxID=1260050 RepID=A0ABP0ANQ0_9PEZI